MSYESKMLKQFYMRSENGLARIYFERFMSTWRLIKAFYGLGQEIVDADCSEFGL